MKYHPGLERLRAIADLVRTDPRAAQTAAAAYLTDNAERPAAWRASALVARAMGNLAVADQHDISAIVAGARRPAFAAAHNAFVAGHLEEAETRLRAYLLDEDPEDAGGALLLAKIALRCGAHQQAENLARRAIQLAPSFVEAWMALARIQHEAGAVYPALASLDHLLALAPTHIDALALKAGILVQLRRLDEADAVFCVLHQHHPDDSRGWMNHAFMLKTIGRGADATAAYRRAIALQPANGQAWWGLANLRSERFDETDIATMEAALSQPTITDEERLHLHFALGKVLEGQAHYAGAFAQFTAGAALRVVQTPHNPDRVSANVARVTEIFTPRFYADREGWGCPADDPIFIISLPRSGSTLVEQILASHSQVEGTEELFDLERIALDIGRDLPGGYLDRIERLTRDEVRALGEAYLASTRRFRQSGRARFTDKMPGNWAYAGLIRLILPNAGIVAIRRHPLGCGVANFTQHFNWGIDFSYDLAHIGQFYADFVKQMAHFDAVAPGHICQLTHESLVDDFENQVRRMLDHLGMDFEPACLRFHETARPIHTPSSEQVRRPINRDGFDRWRNYDPWLGPLKAALGSVLDHYPLNPPHLD